jgi:alkanesulfonate monooxygenase SsuD/methylene tetrahydromethanopterin reductase-like flavin-dependent oxidoreductase (luciferase family)
MNVVRDEDLAQLFAGLSAISRGRVIMGLGLGGFPHEFAAAGYPSGLHERAELLRANIEICRRRAAAPSNTATAGCRPALPWRLSRS